MPHFHKEDLFYAHFLPNKTVFLPISSVFVLMSPDFAYFVTCFCNITNPLNAASVRKQAPGNATASAILHTFNISSMQVISV